MWEIQLWLIASCLPPSPIKKEIFDNSTTEKWNRATKNVQDIKQLCTTLSVIHQGLSTMLKCSLFVCAFLIRTAYLDFSKKKRGNSEPETSLLLLPLSIFSPIHVCR